MAKESRIITMYKKMANNPVTVAGRKKGNGDDRTGSISFGKSVKPNKNTPKAKKIVKPIANVVKKVVKKK